MNRYYHKSVINFINHYKTKCIKTINYARLTLLCFFDTIKIVSLCIIIVILSVHLNSFALTRVNIHNI